jgi:hypothetical protein
MGEADDICRPSCHLQKEIDDLKGRLKLFEGHGELWSPLLRCTQSMRMLVRVLLPSGLAHVGRVLGGASSCLYQISKKPSGYSGS